jgi:mRNA interferase MazF
MSKTIVALISSNVRRAAEDTQFLIERGHPDFPASGLHRNSTVNCANLYTIRQSDISRVIGRLSRATMEQIDAGLRAALSLL